MNDPMLLDARYYKAELERISTVNRKSWAEAFISFHLEFWHTHARGLISSCEHGINYFDDVIGLCEGTLEWKEKGEYGENFRKMVKERPIEA